MALLAETGQTVVEPLQGTSVTISTSSDNGINIIEPLTSTGVTINASNDNGLNVLEPLLSTTILDLVVSNADGFNVIEVLTYTQVNNLPVSNADGLGIIEQLTFSPITGLLTPYGTGPYTISGTVQNGSSAPIARTVVAYDRFNNLPLDVATSDPVTGAFVLNVPYTSCYVVCLPTLADGSNAEIYDQITPV